MKRPTTNKFPGLDLECVDRIYQPPAGLLPALRTGQVTALRFDLRRITPAHRQGFASVAAAQLAGYRPCQHCRPTTAVAGASS